jgi:hypothetical protein
MPVTKENAPLSDKWYYTHASATHGPASAMHLRGLVETKGLHRDDLIWPESLDAVAAIPAEAALAFPTPAQVEPRDFEPAPAPAPEWVRELRDAIAAGGDVANLPPPSAQSWLPDVRDADKRHRDEPEKSGRFFTTQNGRQR